MSQSRLRIVYPFILVIVGILGWYKVLNFWFLKAFDPFWLRSALPYSFFTLIRTHAFLYYLDWKLFGWQPWGWYLVGLILHLIATLLLYHFLTLITKQRLFAFITAFFFVANICYSDVLTWGSFNSYYPLLLSFMLLTFISFYYFRKTKQVLFLGLTLLFFWLSLLVRETGLIIAPLLTIFDFLF